MYKHTAKPFLVDFSGSIPKIIKGEENQRYNAKTTLVNPDLEPVYGVPLQNWKKMGSLVTVKSEAECRAEGISYRTPLIHHKDKIIENLATRKVMYKSRYLKSQLYLKVVICIYVLTILVAAYKCSM
jgi:hypothetical protein